MNISRYTNRGVIIPCPESVEIDESIPPENIAPGVVIHSGCRIRGEATSIGPGCILGAEAPATVENCQLGHGVELKGGYFSSSTFLDKSAMGSGAHVREGTLLEEEANAAHAVGLKQTIFLPFVTAGSLINFCDCLMAGGTSRSNHSEIGSSYIHFNYTPRQDKATASLVGDVPRGVMLDQAPIFLGGQGGLVGPVRIAYGTTIVAGSICRTDILDENLLYIAPAPQESAISDFNQAQYRNIQKIVYNNLLYIGNLHALLAWYRWVRKKTLSADTYARACRTGALNCIESGLRERIKQLKKLAEKLPRSLEIADSQDYFPKRFRRQQQSFLDQWSQLEDRLRQEPPENTAEAQRDRFLAGWEALEQDLSHPDAVTRLDPGCRAAGTEWLQAIVDFVSALWTAE
jgi:hypothetical protein